jgi:hypothetical protein
MKILLSDFYFDLFESFNWDKTRIDTQIELDYHRLVCNINRRHILTKTDFYRIINGLQIPKLQKRLIWILPTQATVYPLLKYTSEQYPQYIVAEMRDCYNPITINIRMSKHIEVEITKNFALLKNEEDEIHTVGVIYGHMTFLIGGSDKYVNLDIKFNPNNFIML